MERDELAAKRLSTRTHPVGVVGEKRTQLVTQGSDHLGDQRRVEPKVGINAAVVVVMIVIVFMVVVVFVAVVVVMTGVRVLRTL